MARVCDITGKRTKAGNHVSHSNRKVKRTFKANVHKRTILVPQGNGSFTKIKLNVSTKALRLIDKLGIEKVISKYLQD